MSFILSIDQSTQMTKALLFDGAGKLICRQDVAHRQIIDGNGWVSHDPEEIYQNLVESVRLVLTETRLNPAEIACVGISNQRETSVVWDKASGKPVCNAIVWQCARAKDLCRRVADAGWSKTVQARTGIPISPFFPASKFAWVLENIPVAKEKASRHELCFGTIDTWLVYCLTNGGSYKTDYSNASRTQLFNLTELRWDAEICGAFGLEPEDLPQVCDSDACFGMTTIGGLLSRAIPIHAVLGDSHGALFGQGCLDNGMAKVTYGTGASVMMNIGDRMVSSTNGLVTSLAWKFKGQVQYVMEGNLNYAGAVIRWLEKDLGLAASAAETQTLAENANPDDTTYMVPAFTGLGAPYWNDDAKAMIYGITRLTGKAELVKAGLECIAYQITDIVKAMEQDTGLRLEQLRVDGGPTKNRYLMQMQSDLLNAQVLVPSSEELSGCGAAYMAGLAQKIYDDSIFSSLERTAFNCRMDHAASQKKYSGWRDAVSMVLGAASRD